MSGSNRSSDGWRPEPTAPTSAPPKRAGDGDGDGGNDPCVINEIAALNSPNPAVLPTLRVGTVLDVQLEFGPPPRLLAKDSSNNTAGTITSRSMLQIMECIQDGSIYVAEVLSISGGACQVRVRLA
ncbi:hypothetical protein DIE18_30685 [Burkholderia sp. Bp9125]|nr:hypothetical protein DIE18_30685 [Burkholderia sp. Bp9125]